MNPKTVGEDDCWEKKIHFYMNVPSVNSIVSKRNKDYPVTEIKVL
jgi:hypothetical protein